MATTRLGLGGPATAYPGFSGKSASTVVLRTIVITSDITQVVEWETERDVPTVHVMDEGTQFQVTVRDQDGVIVDVSSASVLTMEFTKPNGRILTRTATKTNGGGDGVADYTTATGELDALGAWYVRVYAEIGAWKGRGNRYRFSVTV